jgi:hypothetical protein
VTIGGAPGAWAILNGTYTVAYADADNLTMTRENGTDFGALTGSIILAGSYLQAGTLAVQEWGGK